MRSLIIIILASYDVKCYGDASYYADEISEEFTKEPKPFRVYWNVPTMQCKSKEIPFEDLYEKFGIIQNTGDSFRGDEIVFLYDTGDFPALLKNEASGKYRLKNGGVPQEGDLDRHSNVFTKVLEKNIPDPNFSGIGIIDFQSWRPVFQQNFGSLSPTRIFSFQIERKQHKFWSERAIQANAMQRFEEAAREFMRTTLVIAKTLRPFAKWGYYAYPYCFNMSPSNPNETCASDIREENDKIDWLWQESTALFPSTYFTRGTSALDMAQTIRGRVAEAARLTKTTTPILPYFRFRYQDGDFLPQNELDTILETFYNSSASGFIIWGSSGDVNTDSKCQKLLKYTEEVLGPAITKYTKRRGSPNFNKLRPVTQPTESGIDLIPKTSPQTNRSSGEKHESLVNTITSIDYNFSTESTLKLRQTSTPASTEIPSTIIPTTGTDAIVELTNIKENGNNIEENTGSKTSVTNVMVTTPYINEDVTNKEIGLQSKNEKKDDREEGGDVHYWTTDSSPIPLNNNESEMSLQTKNEKEDHPKYNTISTINIILTPSNNEKVNNEFSFSQTESENNDSHVDVTSSILPTESIMIPISNNEILSKDSLLQSKNEEKGQHMIFTSDPVPATDSITFDSDEVTRKGMVLESSTTLEHKDKKDSLNTIDYRLVTSKIELVTFRAVKLEEKIDTGDETYEEFEVGDQLYTDDETYEEF